MDKENFHFCIKERTALNIQAKDIHEELCFACGDETPSLKTIEEWSKWFRESREEAEDEVRPDRLVIETTSENIEQQLKEQQKRNEEVRDIPQLVRDFLDTAEFYQQIKNNLCHHIITANEGSDIGLACGSYVATGQPSLNSGLGNIVNPIISLATPNIYGLPMLLLIGWRGEPGKPDEPQHRFQGPATPSLLGEQILFIKTLNTICIFLAALGIPFQSLPNNHDGAGQAVETARHYMKTTKGPYALLVKRETFLPYTLPKIDVDVEIRLPLTREQALEYVMNHFRQQDIVVSTTGMLSRELFELRTKRHDGHERDFLTVGGMGHASSIALGIAIQKPNRTVYCLDGDGAVLMHMGILANIAAATPSNFKHIVFNNGAHDSVGGQPTVAGNHEKFSFCHIAQGCGYKHVIIATNQSEINEAMEKIRAINSDGPILLELRIQTGYRKNLGRPTRSTDENRKDFMHFLQLN
ncbi:unnamed protein product [Rotaria sordida]|uniref:2-hydroxyacyl-CoA lyase 2 n=2 Tax=Rotaria sordida TaxID=392033 RepID=A0A815P5R7_9BILA|nr:unnamed protein product [Rotaria sordida]